MDRSLLRAGIDTVHNYFNYNCVHPLEARGQGSKQTGRLSREERSFRLLLTCGLRRDIHRRLAHFDRVVRGQSSSATCCWLISFNLP